MNLNIKRSAELPVQRYIIILNYFHGCYFRTYSLIYTLSSLEVDVDSNPLFSPAIK